MASANLVELTDANFEAEVLKSSQPVLVDFWADWCQPCKMLTPTIEKIANNFAGKAKVGKINTDNARNTAIKYGINAIPTVILFNNGQPVQKWVGLNGENTYASALQPLVK
jgi:thioredoxin 1